MAANTIGFTMLKTLVLSPAGPFRQELLAFVRSIPGLELTSAAAEPRELLARIELAAPQLLIVVGAAGFMLTAEALANARMRASFACLVLAENQQQIQQALSAGADAALLNGFSTQEFLSTLAHITEGKR